MRDMIDRVYTLEIDAKAIASFPAGSFQEAQSLLKEKWLRDDLRELKSKGVPVWDGKSKLTVRNAYDGEQARFERETKQQLASDDLPIVYLITLY